MRRTLRPSPRPGFTLVELLVASALIVLTMAIMATAFQAVLAAYSDLNSAANLSDQLRSMTDAVRRDLRDDHLEDEDGAAVRVSSPRVTAAGWSGTGKKGFLRAQRSANTDPVSEGTEDGLPSFRSGGAPNPHVLHMTCRRSGAQQKDTFAARAPLPLATASHSLSGFDATGEQYVSRWAEVAYFLAAPAGNPATNDANGLGTHPLYALYRRERVLSAEPFSFPPMFDPTTVYPGLSTRPVGGGNYVMNTPADIVTTGRLPAYVPIAGGDTGSDLLLANVISFQVMPSTNANPLVFESSPGRSITPGTFLARDTAAAPTSTTESPVIRGLEIKVRVYDPKTSLTRQVTIREGL